MSTSEVSREQYEIIRAKLRQKRVKSETDLARAATELLGWVAGCTVFSTEMLCRPVLLLLQSILQADISQTRGVLSLQVRSHIMISLV